MKNSSSVGTNIRFAMPNVFIQEYLRSTLRHMGVVSISITVYSTDMLFMSV